MDISSVNFDIFIRTIADVTVDGILIGEEKYLLHLVNISLYNNGKIFSGHLLISSLL